MNSLILKKSVVLSAMLSSVVYAAPAIIVDVPAETTEGDNASFVVKYEGASEGVTGFEFVMSIDGAAVPSINCDKLNADLATCESGWSSGDKITYLSFVNNVINNGTLMTIDVDTSSLAVGDKVSISISDEVYGKFENGSTLEVPPNGTTSNVSTTIVAANVAQTFTVNIDPVDSVSCDKTSVQSTDIDKTVTCTANPPAGQELDSFTGACSGTSACTFELDADKTVGAIFKAAVVVPVDSDGDGVEDSLDAFPNDASETMDTDGDGVGDNADAFPNDASETMDTDGDGVGDNADAYPTDPSRTKPDPARPVPALGLFGLLAMFASMIGATSFVARRRKK